MKASNLILAIAVVLCAAPLRSEQGRPVLSREDREAWILCLKRVKMKPPCCGACKIITDAGLKSLWNHLVSEKVSEKDASVWKSHKEKLLEEFKRLYPERYKALYENRQKQGGPK